MFDWQRNFLVVFLIFSFLAFVKGLYESKVKNNSFGISRVFTLLGAFVWADAVVFGIFWTFIAVLILIFQDWLLFLVIFSAFWFVRSHGETMYWLNQQFSKQNLNPTERFWWSKIFHTDAVWFVFQIYWQCLTVVTLVTTIYLVKLWLKL